MYLGIQYGTIQYESVRYGTVINYGTVPYGTCTVPYLYNKTYNSTYGVVQQLRLQVAKATNRKYFIFIMENKHLCRKKLSVKVGATLNAFLLLPLKLRSGGADLLPFGVSPLGRNGSNAEL